MAHEDKNPLFSERFREQLLLRRILVLDGVLDDDNGTLLATQLLTLAYFGPPFSGTAADAMRAYLGVNRSRSAHRYTLGDFGLTAAQVGARFGALGRSAAELR